MIVGIDLGTTNSLIGIYGEDGVRLVPNVLGDLLTPSAVSLDEKGQILVGRAARDRAVEAIAAAARTGQIGDGKIFVHSIERALRIRTGEQDAEAL